MSNPREPSRIIFRQGERVALVLLEKDDIEILTHAINNAETTQFLNAYLPVTRESQENWVEKCYKNTEHNMVFGLWHTGDQKLIGTMGLHRISWRDGVASTGAMIFEPAYRSQGLGSEAKHLLLDYAFNTLGLRKICSEVLAFNERSQAYNKKCGYVVEGVRKQHVFRDGRYHDQIMMAVFRDTWEAVRASS